LVVIVTPPCSTLTDSAIVRYPSGPGPAGPIGPEPTNPNN
jgi:hypothetical protein